jgi:hypothetical protein
VKLIGYNIIRHSSINSTRFSVKKINSKKCGERIEVNNHFSTLPRGSNHLSDAFVDVSVEDVGAAGRLCFMTSSDGKAKLLTEY